MHVVFAPHSLAGPRPWLFLAGSIEQGRAELWQDRVIEHFAAEEGTILNPRRPDWDASWKQSIHDARFREQVEWELEAQEKADRIVMYFDPATKAPITLMELGLFADTGKLSVACPEGYWRRGNVEVVCARYGIPFVDTLERLLAL